MSKIKNVNPAVVVVFLLNVFILARDGADWLVLCALTASVAALVYPLITGRR